MVRYSWSQKLQLLRQVGIFLSPLQWWLCFSTGVWETVLQNNLVHWIQSTGLGSWVQLQSSSSFSTQLFYPYHSLNVLSPPPFYRAGVSVEPLTSSTVIQWSNAPLETLPPSVNSCKFGSDPSNLIHKVQREPVMVWNTELCLCLEESHNLSSWTPLGADPSAYLNVPCRLIARQGVLSHIF